jgi:1-acyl-sn-glycerol-3-phosphate acyltransferase
LFNIVFLIGEKIEEGDKMVFWISAFVFKIFAKIYLRGKGIGKENFPEKAPYIAVTNHNSNMDSVAMALVVKHRGYAMAKDSLFKVPILKWWVKAVGMFPVARDTSDQQAFNHALDLLKSGKILFMAPEGTRKKIKGQRKRPRTGFVRMAQMVGCPVVPIAIWGTDKVLPPGAWFPKPTKVAVKVGKPIYLEKIEVSKEQKQPLQQQADYVMDIIYQLVEELDRLYERRV